MKSLTLPHGLAYIGGALLASVLWLSNQSPDSFVFLGPKAATIAGAGIGLAGALIAFAHQSGWIPSKPIDKITTSAKVLIPLVLILPLLHGCASVQGLFSSPAAEPVITAAVDVAVATAEQKGITAAQINGIAVKALAADQGAGATLATVSALVNAELLKLNLPAGDLAAASILEAFISAEIEAKLTNADGTVNTSLAAAQADVAQVLNAVIAITAGPPTTDTLAPAPAITLADQAPRSTSLALVESPPVVGAASSALIVACLQAFGHVSVGAPVAAAVTVLATLGAAYLQL